MKIYSMDIEKLIEESFVEIFNRYKFEKIGHYKFRNKQCTFRVEIIDPFGIRMEFSNNDNPEEYYSQYPYLCMKLKESYYEIEPSLYTPEYQKYKNEELAIKHFFNYLSNFATNHFHEPFSGDFSWHKEYNEVLNFISNQRKIISEDKLYSELKPMLNNYKHEDLRRMGKAALKIYFEQKGR